MKTLKDQLKDVICILNQKSIFRKLTYVVDSFTFKIFVESLLICSRVEQHLFCPHGYNKLLHSNKEA